MRIKLSIIVPVYNVENYIRNTLDSIFSQSFPRDEVEIIIVNDGTTDSSMSIVHEFANNYLTYNFKILNQINQGLSAARNAGISSAVGDYLWFVDGDDRIRINSVARILELIESYNGSDVFLFKIAEYNEDGVF